MKKNWVNILGLFTCIIIGFPSYAHASGGYGDMIGPLLLTLLVIFVIMLILREVACWYWKINETLSVLKEIRDLLSGGITKSNNKPGGSMQSTAANTGSSTSEKKLKITVVKPDTQGSKIDLWPGDILKSYNGVKLQTNSDLSDAIFKAKNVQKEEVDLVVIRNNKLQTHKIAVNQPLGVSCEEE